jgi:hypothetical protein
LELGSTAGRHALSLVRFRAEAEAVLAGPNDVLARGATAL